MPRLFSQRPDSASLVHAEVCGSGVRDAALDFVHPQLSAGRVRGTEVVDSLAGFQLEKTPRWTEEVSARQENLWFLAERLLKAPKAPV